MSGRRLPLHNQSRADAAAPGALLAALDGSSWEPTVLSGRVVAVADTGSCQLAMQWAARLLDQLLVHQRSAHVLLTSFDRELHLDGAARQLFGKAGSLQGLALGAADVAGVPAGLPKSDEIWLLVGQPALLAYRAPLSVLLESAVPVLRWPERMRALRGRCVLDVAGEGFSLCAPLAAGLAAR